MVVIAAEPSTDAIWRVSLYTPEPAPARCGGRLRVADTDSGPQMQAFAAPRIIIGPTISHRLPSATIVGRSRAKPTTISVKPITAIHFGSLRFRRAPTTGANAPENKAIGAVISAAWVGSRPSTCCRYRVSGNAMLIATTPIAEIATFDTEKLRSLKRLSGTSGSRGLIACHPMNRPSTRMPAIIRPHTLTGTPVPMNESVMVPQS